MRILKYRKGKEGALMAMSLEPTVLLSDHDELGPCPLCGSQERNPDDMSKWAAHLTELHGYSVVEDTPRPPDGSKPRTIRLELTGWSTKAKFRPNQRVNVKADSRPRDYAGRRGTVVGWHPGTSEYVVRFDEDPVYGFLSSHTLEAYVRPAAVEPT
jgi:hypothetical protein